MSESTKKRWMSMAGVFVAVFGSFAALMYLSVRTFDTQQTRSNTGFFRFQDTVAKPGQATVDPWRIQPPTPGPAPSPNKTRHLLSLNRENKIGDIVLIYRGLEGRSKFRLDAVVPALDPDYTYVRKIDLTKARKGFRLGGERFVLISAGKTSIRILRQIQP